MSKPADSNIAQAEDRFAHAIGLSGSCCAGASRCLLAILVLLTILGSSACLAGEPIAIGAPEAPKPVLSSETGTGKSYLLNGYDRIAYPNEVEEGEKIYDTNPSIFRDHVVHGHWGSDQGNFSTNQFKHPDQES